MCKKHCRHPSSAAELRIVKHVDALGRIFPNLRLGENTPMKVMAYKNLKAIEREAHHLAEAFCNGDVKAGEIEFNRREAKILDKLDKILDFRALEVPVFINGDPRGYTLKIDSNYEKIRKVGLATDWGGYGLIAPNVEE